MSDEDRPSNEEMERIVMSLVKKGIMDYTVNEEGEFIFFLTPIGKAMGAHIIEHPEEFDDS